MLDLEIIRNCNDFYNLKQNSWSGAIDTLEDIEKYDKIEEFNEMLNELFDEPVDETKLNDFLWFDRDYIYEELGIDIDE